MNRQDIRNVNQWMHGFVDDDGTEHMGLIDAMNQLEDIYETYEAGNGAPPSTHPDYKEAHQAAKNAFAGILNAANDAVDRTDVLEDAQGNALDNLPEGALARDGASVDLPADPRQ